MIREIEDEALAEAQHRVREIERHASEEGDDRARRILTTVMQRIAGRPHQRGHDHRRDPARTRR